MPDDSGSLENMVKVPELMYNSFLTLSNPRKLAIFDALCRTKSKMTTKDIEIALQKPGSSESLGYIADALRDLFRRLNLTPSDSVGIAFDLILFFVGLLCSLSYGIARVPGLLVRVAYWRKIRRERERN